MLKSIGIITFLALPIITQANQYEVVISDLSTGEEQIESEISEMELRSVTNFLLNLRDESIKFKIRKINLSNANAMKIIGGEGSGD